MSIRLLAYSTALCGGSVEILPTAHILPHPQNKMRLHQKGQQEKPDGLNSAQAGSLPRFVWVFHVHRCIIAVLLLLLSRSQPRSPCVCSWAGKRPRLKSSSAGRCRHPCSRETGLWDRMGPQAAAVLTGSSTLARPRLLQQPTKICKEKQKEGSETPLGSWGC